MKRLPALRTVRARLTLWNVGVLALVLLVLGSVLRVSATRNLTASVDRELALRARRHQIFWAQWPREAPPLWVPLRMPMPPSTARRGASQGSTPRRSRDDSGARPRWEARIVERILNLQGQQLFQSGEGTLWDRDGFSRAVRGQSVYATLRGENDQIRVLSAPLHSGGQIRGVVQVGYSLAEVNRALGNLNRTLLTLIPVALAAAGLGGLFLTGRMLRPVREITQAAAGIGVEDLSQRLSVGSGDEFSELAATFNGMLGRLERSFEQQRRFTADASHELRTPLTVIKATTSLALSRGGLSGEHRKTMESVDRAASLMNRIVQDLLLIARSDAGQLALPLRPLRLAEVLEVALECVEASDGPPVNNTVSELDLWVQGDTSHLTRLFANLLDNAVRHTPPEGRITLSARRERDMVVVTVEDTGSGIPPEHLPHVCERFYRVDEARSRAGGGTGLGLAICQSIVRAHEGRLEITSSPGTGTSVQVTLRAASPAEG